METSILAQQIYSFDYPGKVEEIVDKVKDKPVSNNTNNLRSLTTYLLDEPEFQELKLWVKEKVREVLASQDYRFGLRITQSWFNASNKGMWHHRHSHSNSFLSGILYLTPSGSHTWFSTESIWLKGGEDNHFPFMARVPHPYKDVIHKYPTTPGKLLLFPSTLDHSVDEHDLDEPRYTIAFNTFPVGTFGSNYNYTEVIVE